jgi:hypothetical protein
LAIIRVEPLARALDEAVEVVQVENLIQSRVERMGGAARQVVGVVRRIDRVDPEDRIIA